MPHGVLMGSGGVECYFFMFFGERLLHQQCYSPESAAPGASSASQASGSSSFVPSIATFQIIRRDGCDFVMMLRAVIVDVVQDGGDVAGSDEDRSRQGR